MTTIVDLLASSSLGGPGARQLRERVAAESVAEVLRRAGALGVVVAGGGLLGLTTAIRLAEAGIPVRVVTNRPPGQSISIPVCARWCPKLSSGPREVAWARHTRAELERVARDPSSGVRIVTGIEAAPDPTAAPAWLSEIPGFQLCAPDELPAGYATGWAYPAPVAEMSMYLSYLEHRLYATGTRIELDTIANADHLAALGPVVVNCTGLGAAQVVADQLLHPIRGQLVIVENPGIDQFFEDLSENGPPIYIIPDGAHVILGGTVAPGAHDDEDPAATAEIVDRCIRIEPRLRHARVLKSWVGVRPCRERVRLDIEQYRDTLVVHNYGHGGYGLTLSWGCADHVLHLVTRHALS